MLEQSIYTGSFKYVPLMFCNSTLRTKSWRALFVKIWRDGSTRVNNTVNNLSNFRSGYPDVNI